MDWTVFFTLVLAAGLAQAEVGLTQSRDGTSGTITDLGNGIGIISDPHGNSGLLVLPPHSNMNPSGPHGNVNQGTLTPFGTPAPPNNLTPAPVLPFNPNRPLMPPPSPPPAAPPLRLRPPAQGQVWDDSADKSVAVGFHTVHRIAFFLRPATIKIMSSTYKSFSTRSTEILRQTLLDVRGSLLSLHKALILAEQVTYERIHGRVASTGQLLQLVLNDPWFTWLHPLSQLVVRIDDLLDDESELSHVEVEHFLIEARGLIRPSEEGDGFERSYYEALQREPDVIFAHVEVKKLLTKIAA